MATYWDELCPPKLAFLHVGGSKFLQISLERPESSLIRVRVKTKMKNN